jgi:formate hydrogenlyase subunit 6/NADH:ubiquinone oxidoreductase subunit I
MSFLPMARLALRNLVTRPVTRRYPYVVRTPFAGSRGRIIIDFPACIHCLACAKHCPADAIVVDREAKSWKIDRFACVICGACIRVCPKKCLLMSPERPRALDFADVAGRGEEHRAIDA